MLYRIGQGLRALSAWTRPVDLTPAEAILNPQLLALFKRMRRSEHLHSLGVLDTLRAQGHTHADLLVAALLHDVGKTRAPIGLFGRTLVVLAKAFLPSLYRRLGQGPARGVGRPFAVAEGHPAWGAEMIAAAGGSERAAMLVRRHQERVEVIQTDEDRLLVALQAADSAN